MKNLLIYTNADKEFSEENKTLVKIHIDNSLELGWDRKDILLYTNFPYEYNGVSAQIVPDDLDLAWDRPSNKILVIQYLLKNNMLEKDLYWYHDFDAYQNEPITEEELEMDGFDFAITGYGYKPQANGGSFFFRENTLDIFNLWCERTIAICRTRADEKSLTDMVRDGSLERYKDLNLTYNFGQRAPVLCYDMATKPLNVLHFHPHYKFYPKSHWNIDVFMHGRNDKHIPLMSDRLIRIFKSHGVQ